MNEKVFKKGLGVALAVSLVFAGGVWASPAITLIVNGQRAAAEVRVINGVTFLPLRAVAELLGVPVHWDSRTRTITVGSAKPAPAPVRAALGTRKNPVPIGTKAPVGQNWTVTVLEINPDAWSIIRAENMFNEPPAEGRQFVLVRVRVSYVGPKSGTPWLDLSFRYLGSDGNTYGGGMADSAGVIHRPLIDIGEQFPGASAEGNVSWSVPATAISGGAIIVEDPWMSAETRVFFAGSK